MVKSGLPIIVAQFVVRRHYLMTTLLSTFRLGSTLRRPAEAVSAFGRGGAIRGLKRPPVNTSQLKEGRRVGALGMKVVH